MVDQLKKNKLIFDYYLHWFENELREVLEGFDGRVIILSIKLVKNRLFLEDGSNINILAISERGDLT